MNLFKFLAVTLVETLLRVLPFPCKTGLVKIGNPDRNAPVLLTCNYHLTVERVKRGLKGVDAYLLIANSRGINVWCASTGGLFTSHDVISALKTTGIEGLVDHRDLILPQLAATGVEREIIRKKSRWRVIWGPVHARDITAFIENGYEKTPKMQEVEFPLTQRIEMAVAWAFPISIIFALFAILFWREAVLRLSSLVWGLSLFIFLSFPLYSHWLSPGAKRVGFVFLDFGRGGFQLILWGALTLGLITYSMGMGDFAWGFIFRWSFIALVIVVLLSIDVMGSTPVFKSSLHEDRLLAIHLDEGRCRGAGFCEQVCPRNCYAVDRDRHSATIPRARRCVKCGACIVQCPFDALYFRDLRGEIVTAETVRRFKLNLLGRRLVKVERRWQRGECDEGENGEGPRQE